VALNGQRIVHFLWTGELGSSVRDRFFVKKIVSEVWRGDFMMIRCRV
jgi:hypothetical protein